MTSKEFAEAIIKKVGEGTFVLKPNQIIFDHPDFPGLGIFPEHYGKTEEDVVKIAENIKNQWQPRKIDAAHDREGQEPKGVETKEEKPKAKKSTGSAKAKVKKAKKSKKARKGRE